MSFELGTLAKMLNLKFQKIGGGGPVTEKALFFMRLSDRHLQVFKYIIMTRLS